MRRAGVMGDPVSHSLSPILHGYWLKQYQIGGEYLPLLVKKEELKTALSNLNRNGFSGCNLTIPHKEAALDYVDEVSDIAGQIGAINTVIVKENGSLFGTNTDAEGFIQNLRYRVGDLSPYLDHCLILGAGGAAKAVYFALKHADAKRISLCNRNAERAKGISESVIEWELRETALSDVTLLINTTSLGMKNEPSLDLSLEALPKQALVTDIVYHPLKTQLLQNAQTRGNPIVTGIGMLIFQAVAGFEAWFGIRPQVDEGVFALLEGRLS